MQKTESLQLAFKWASKNWQQPGAIQYMQESYQRFDCYRELVTLHVLTMEDMEENESVDIAHMIQHQLAIYDSAAYHDSIVGQNMTLLASKIGLNPLEAEIMVLLIMAKHYDILKASTNSLGRLNKSRFCQTIATMLDADYAAVQSALSPSGRLVKTSLLEIQHAPSLFEEKYDFIYSFDEYISDDLRSLQEMVSMFVTLVEDVSLTLDDYVHIAHELDYIVPYLKTALASQQRSCNILLYGSPGTGKTELVKTLAHAVNATLYEVNTTNRDHQTLDAEERLSSYNAGCHLLIANGCNMLLFDEMEDAMPSSYGNGEKKPRKNKAWFNRLLENTPIPTIWTSNDVQCIDNAYLRRFDIVLEMSPPDSSQRLRLLKTAFNSTHYEDAWLARVSNQLVLPPSEGSRIAKVVTLANSNAKSQVHATQLIKHSYKAIHLQVPAFDKPDLQQPIIEYQLEWLNTVCDITALCNALSTSKHGKLCLYGPPGCGKTQFAHYLAQRTGQPLLSKKASDLVSPFVGESEQNIAQLFAEAAETASILLIDEADSFFMERNAYRASWEVTMVNELLVQMEQFNGIFIASTNRIASFDPASKRRFDFKIAFDYLTHEQIVSLFCTVVDEPATVADLENAGRLRTLTPGNFLTAKRQAWLTQQPLTSTMLLTILKEESLNNPENNSRTAIGFIH